MRRPLRRTSAKDFARIRASSAGCDALSYPPPHLSVLQPAQLGQPNRELAQQRHCRRAGSAEQRSAGCRACMLTQCGVSSARAPLHHRQALVGVLHLQTVAVRPRGAQRGCGTATMASQSLCPRAEPAIWSSVSACKGHSAHASSKRADRWGGTRLHRCRGDRPAAAA
jgi:hypothetical protein